MINLSIYFCWNDESTSDIVDGLGPGLRFCAGRRGTRRRSSAAVRPHSATSGNIHGRLLQMEYRQLGRSGLKVSTVTLGTMTMGGKGKFASVGEVCLDEERRQIDMCID